MDGAGGSGRRETYHERRDRRAEIEDPEVVLNAAARYLEARSRSAEEVRTYLTEKGYRAELIASAIERLQRAHMLDDEVFARSWIESRDRAQPRGEYVLRRELAQKGIDRETVDSLLLERRQAAIEAPFGEGADLEAAVRLLEKRRSALLRTADPRLRVQKAYALLARSGFDPEICRAVSQQLAADGEAEESPEEEGQ